MKIEFLLIRHSIVILQLHLYVQHTCDKTWKVILCSHFILHLVCISSHFAVGTVYFKCLWIVCSEDLILFFFFPLSPPISIWFVSYVIVFPLVLLCPEQANSSPSKCSPIHEFPVHVTHSPKQSNDVIVDFYLWGTEVRKNAFAKDLMKLWRTHGERVEWVHLWVCI